VNNWTGNKMSSGLELADSRVNYIAQDEGVVVVHFSFACIFRSKGKPGQDLGTEWGQEAELIFQNAELFGPLPPLPNSIADGYLEVGGIKHEVVPLPFQRKVRAKLNLMFVDGSEIEIVGDKPVIELLGKPIYLEDFT
jgi:hypothetical protein